MKRIVIFRGKSQKPVKLPNGDKYDSRLVLMDGDHGLFTTDQCNTDRSVRYPTGGTLSPGKYYGIMGYRYNAEQQAWTGKRIIKLFRTTRQLYNITRHFDLTDSEQILPSTEPNPNHGGKPVIQYAQIHQGGSPADAKPWDWSQGCITLMGEEWLKLSAKITDNEILEVELVG